MPHVGSAIVTLTTVAGLTWRVIIIFLSTGVAGGIILFPFRIPLFRILSKEANLRLRLLGDGCLSGYYCCTATLRVPGFVDSMSLFSGYCRVAQLISCGSGAYLRFRDIV